MISSNPSWLHDSGEVHFVWLYRWFLVWAITLDVHMQVYVTLCFVLNLGHVRRKGKVICIRIVTLDLGNQLCLVLIPLLVLHQRFSNCFISRQILNSVHHICVCLRCHRITKVVDRDHQALDMREAYNCGVLPDGCVDAISALLFVGHHWMHSLYIRHLTKALSRS